MLPTYTVVRLPLILEIAKRGGRTHPSEVYEALAIYFNLSQEDLDKESEDITAGRKESKWRNWVRWVRKDLVKLGFIIPSNGERGVWELTDKGKEVADCYNRQLENRPAIEVMMKELGLENASYKFKVEIYDRAINAGCTKDQALKICDIIEEDLKFYNKFCRKG